MLVMYWDPCIDWLVTYLESCIERRDCHYITSPIRYWSHALKGEIVTTLQVQLGIKVRVQLQVGIRY